MHGNTDHFYDRVEPRKFPKVCRAALPSGFAENGEMPTNAEPSTKKYDDQGHTDPPKSRPSPLPRKTTP
jgi:hypothetical protein